MSLIIVKNSGNTLPATAYDESSGFACDLVGDCYYPRLAVPGEQVVRENVLA